MGNPKSRFRIIIDFFSVTDVRGDLSLTNVALWVLIAKIAISPLDWPTAAGLFLALLNYAHRRHETNKSTAVASLTQNVQHLQDKVDQYQKLHDTVAKQANETQAQINKNNMFAAGMPRGML